MVIFLYNDFLLIDLNLNIINRNNEIIKLKDIDNLEKNNIFIKIINNNYSSDDLECFFIYKKTWLEKEPLEENKLTINSRNNNYIYIKILFFLLFMSIFKNERIFNYFIENKEDINAYIIKYFETNQDIICNLTPYFRQIIILPIVDSSDIFFKKYLKYKNKYIQFKNKLN